MTIAGIFCVQSFIILRFYLLSIVRCLLFETKILLLLFNELKRFPRVFA